MIKNSRTLTFLSIIIVIICFSLYKLNREKQNYSNNPVFKENPNIWAHRVNSKEKYILTNQLNINIETDIIIKKENNNIALMVGHDIGDPANILFSDFLEIKNNSFQQKIWLDLKNLNFSNYEKFISQFEQIITDKKLNRQQFILESTNISIVSKLIKSGYNSSFYIYINKLSTLTEEEKEINLQNRIPSLLKQGITTISFDDKLLSAATKVLTKPISNINFLSWNTTKNFIDDIKYAKSQLKNPFLSVFLIKLHTDFDR